MESDVCAHFGSCEHGSCEHFTIVDVRDRAITGIRMISNRAPYGEHNCAAPSRILKSQVEILLVSDIGGRPLMLPAENKIKVFAGAAGKISDAVQDFNDAILPELSTAGTHVPALIFKMK